IAVPQVISKRLEAGLEKLLELNLGLCFAADEAQISAVIYLLHSVSHLHSIKIKVKVTPANSIQQHEEILFFILQVLKFPRASLNVKIELE
ncbi:hypothetical protein HAX54_023258, partial [Datura stramonium]|nr:hypothetical protein [Datura stramonium]